MKKKRFTVIYGILFAALLMFIVIAFNGFRWAGLSFKASREYCAGTLNAENNLSLQTTAVDTGYNKIKLDQVLLINESQHSLAKCVSAEIQKRLSDLWYVGEVKCIGPGEVVGKVDKLPDLYFRYGLDFIDEQETNEGVCRDAWFYFHIGTDYFSHFRLQLGGNMWNQAVNQISLQDCQLHHHGVFKGKTSKGNEYVIHAENIAESIVEEFDKIYGKQIQTCGLFPKDVPEEIWGDGEEGVGYELIEQYSPELLLDGRKIQYDKLTAWRFYTDKNTQEVFDGIERELEALGWRFEIRDEPDEHNKS